MVLRFRKAFGLFERIFLLASLTGLGLVALAIAMAA
jgi:hypothetical protein